MIYTSNKLGKRKSKKKLESNDIVMIRIGNKNNSVILLDLKKIKKK